MESSAGHIRAGVIPNFLHQEQQAVSAALYEAKRSSGFRSDGTITVGYFSGSPTHNRDFAVAAPALARLMDEDPRIRLRVVGRLGIRGGADTLPGFSAKLDSRVEFCPLQDPMNLQRLIAEVEINMAPLQNNLFTNCKSELKFFEAAIAGTITVATPTYTFSRAIVDGETSFLANAVEWDDKLRAACRMVDDPARYSAMAERGFEVAERTFGWNRHAALIAAAVLDPDSTSVPAVSAATRRPATEEVSAPGLSN
jgi:glycosyltransferase involved in cell wall biosynthesis